MTRSTTPGRERRTLRAATLAIAGLAGGAAALAAGMAWAGTFTLSVTKNVHVTNDPTAAFRVTPVNTHESVAVGPTGFAVYMFQGETTHHLLCKKTTNAATNCWGFWPPVSPRSANHLTEQTGIRGKLGTFHNHGTLQLTLSGRPLYYFRLDLQSHNKHQAIGDELMTFGSTWHVVTADAPAGQAQTSPQPMMPTTNTTTTVPYPYNY
jgi:predicted lipoprotein with Yx(FWY)xxD motif